jgi:oligoribonuclease
MPFESLHYRNRSQLTPELAGLWHGSAWVREENTHKALDDILESIAELKYYREHSASHSSGYFRRTLLSS